MTEIALGCVFYDVNVDDFYSVDIYIVVYNVEVVQVQFKFKLDVQIEGEIVTSFGVVIEDIFIGGDYDDYYDDGF
ncbi:MAG: hypothetical protein EZS28_033658 [Streblomastix strix]|uniref:Uncharacterized protein n=1 Tax=Streblomastix strix TaxID=222440 RepID=A0A5J4UJ53_9EUKA|nr:MAG: hypothetical protein EZS28_033658 [Streblomastix strix]